MAASIEAPSRTAAVPPPPEEPGSGPTPAGQMARSLSFTGPGRVLGRALQFALQLLIGRVLGPGGYGIYSLALSVTETVKQFGLLGLQNGVVRMGSVHLADADYESVRGCWRTTCRTVLLSSALLAAMLWLAAEPISRSILDSNELVWPIRILALSLPLDAWLVLSVFWSRALQRVQLDVLLADLVQPGASILLVAAALFVGASVPGAAVGYGLSCAVAAGVGVIILSRTIRRLPATGLIRYSMGPLLRLSLPMLLAGFAYIFMGHVDKLMIGAMVGAEAAGVYTAAFRLSRQIGLIQTAFVPMFAPLVSGLYHRGDAAALSHLYRETTHWIVVTSLPVVIVLTVFGDLALALYGSQYESARIFLTILSVGFFINLAGVLGHQLLLMVGRQDEELMLVVGGMLLNILLNLVLVRAYGALGAAVATAIAFTGLTAATLAVVRWRTGLWPLSRGLLKPFAISAAAATLGCLMRTMGSGLVWGIVVCFLAVGLYAVGTWFLGLDPRDRERARLAVARLTR